MENKTIELSRRLMRVISRFIEENSENAETSGQIASAIECAVFNSSSDEFSSEVLSSLSTN